jgi:hypothetical protein
VASFFAQQLVPATATNHHSTKQQQQQSVANFPAAAGGQGMKPHQQQWATPPHRVRQQTPSTPAAMKRASDSRRGDIGPVCFIVILAKANRFSTVKNNLLKRTSKSNNIISHTIF